jgi:putative cell wall-binding protein
VRKPSKKFEKRKDVSKMKKFISLLVLIIFALSMPVVSNAQSDGREVCEEEANQFLEEFYAQMKAANGGVIPPPIVLT